MVVNNIVDVVSTGAVGGGSEQVRQRQERLEETQSSVVLSEQRNSRTQTGNRVNL